MRSKYFLLILTILLSGCRYDSLFNLEDRADVANGDTWSPEVIVTRNNGDWPEGCEPEDVANSLVAFIQAFNEGDQAQLEYFFSGPFTVFSQSEIDVKGIESKFTVSYNEEALMPYFQAKYEQNEQWRLNYIKVLHPRGQSLVIEFGMLRIVNDVNDSGKQIEYEYWGSGNGTVRCGNHTLVLWYAETDLQGKREGNCPAPKDEISGDVVIVCTAH